MDAAAVNKACVILSHNPTLPPQNTEISYWNYGSYKYPLATAKEEIKRKEIKQFRSLVVQLIESMNKGH
jgi:hypothetical protein